MYDSLLLSTLGFIVNQTGKGHQKEESYHY